MNRVTEIDLVDPGLVNRPGNRNSRIYSHDYIPFNINMLSFIFGSLLPSPGHAYVL